MATVGDHPSGIDFALERLNGDDRVPMRLFRDLVTGFEELRRKNQELQRSNADLQSNLQHANERLTAFEASGATVSELARFAMTAAAQMVERAAETVEAMRRAAEEEQGRHYEKARLQALQLQMEILSLLDQADEESQQRIRENDQKAIEVLRRTRESITAMAEGLEKGVSAHDGLSSAATAPTTPVPDPHESTAIPPSALRALPPTGDATQGDNTDLLVRPFRDLASLSTFFRVARRLPGVVETRVEALGGDALGLALKHNGDGSPVEQLMALHGARLRIASAGPHRVELEIVGCEASS